MAVWPMVLDIPKDDCSRILRRMELQTYGSCISVLRAQGPLTKEKRQAIDNLRQIFHIKTDRHKAEVRRAVNDELLTTIAERLYGSNTELDWAVEGRRLVPLARRLEPITAYTPIANEVAEMTHIVNASLPPPRDPSRSPTPETDDAEETMEEMEMAPPPPPPPPPPPQPTIIAPMKLPAQPIVPAQPTPAAAALPQPPVVKVDKAASRKRRVPSFESTTQNIPPPSKIPYIPPVSTTSRTVSIPVGVSSTTTRMPNIPTSIRPNTTSASPKVLIVSSSQSATTPSLLQRSLSVPMVKTVKSIGTGLMSTTVTPGPSSFQGSFASTLGAPLLSAPKIRPKTVVPPTVLPKGRGGSIVIPLAPNVPGPGVQLRPPTVVQTKPTLQPVQVKQDASGVKVISGSHKITPKPPMVTVSSGSNRVVSIASAPRISPMISTSQPIISSATITTHGAGPNVVTSTPKPVTLNLPSSSHGPSKQNVILVKKGGSGSYAPMQSQGNITLPTPGRVMIQGTPHNAGAKGVPPGESTSSLAQALHLPPGSRQGNVIVLDLSQDQINKNTALTELLHASGILSMKASTSMGEVQDEMQVQTEPVTVVSTEPKAAVKESSKAMLSPTSAKLKTKILRAVPTRTKTQEPSEYSIKLVSGRASVESTSTPSVVQAKVVREIASKSEPRVIKFDEVAKEVVPKKILPAKEPQKIEVKLQPSVKQTPTVALAPKAAPEILPESQNILVNLIDQVVESSVSVATTPAGPSMDAKAMEKVSPQEESLHEFLTFKKSEDSASKKVLAMLQEEPAQSVCTSLPILDASTESGSSDNPTSGLG